MTPSRASPALPPSFGRAAWLAGLVIVVAVFAAYGDTFAGPFVYDDVQAIVENPSIRHLWPVTDVLFPQLPGGLTVSGRPVLNFSLALNHAVSGDAVWSYHALNLIIHAAAALLLWRVARRMLRKISAVPASRAEPLAAILAALWALHPLQTQAVTYTVQRAESLMGVFYLLTLHAFVRSTECHSLNDTRRAWFWRSVAVAACALGMATKEVMATAPLLVLLYDRTFVAGSFRAAWRERGGFHLALAATWLVLGALVLGNGGNRGGTVGLGVGVAWWAYPLTQFEALTRYLALTAWPQPLVFEYGTRWVQAIAALLPDLIVVLPFLALTLVALRRWPAAGFCGAWFFAILAPTSLAPGTLQMTVEHRMYLPLAGVLALVVTGVQLWLGRRALAIIGAAALALLALTAHRNRDYRSALALWSDTVAKRPANPRARDSFATALAATGQLEAALVQRFAAVRLKPDDARYQFNLAVNLAEARRLEEAIAHYEIALRLDPSEPRIHNNLATTLVAAGRIADALPHQAAAARLKPDDAQFHYNLAVGLTRLQHPTEAMAEYEAALHLQPDFADAHLNLGTALIGAGRMADGIGHYEAAARLQPGDAEVRTTLGNALLVAGRSEDAAAQFRAALTVRPDNAAAHYGLGNIAQAAGRGTDAIAHYAAALRAEPNHVDAHFKLGNLFVAAGRVTEAVAHYESAVRLRPDDAEVHHNLGAAFARLDRLADARREFEAALRLRPDYPDAQRHLAQVQALLNR